jgi:formylglycine-generating enzyme required for sulfatase activity
VPSFSIGKYPVTQAQWQAVMGNNPSEFKGENNPVESVSRKDIVRFCEILSDRTGKAFRLPSEAEWEYAARAGTTTRYSFGDDEGLLEQYAWYKKNSQHQTHPVGEKKPNDWGLYDMYGNVWEWCEDAWHNDYQQDAPVDGHAWDNGSQGLGVVRGGSYFDSNDGCRSARRISSDPNSSHSNIGFRVVVSSRTQ